MIDRTLLVALLAACSGDTETSPTGADTSDETDTDTDADADADADTDTDTDTDADTDTDPTPTGETGAAPIPDFQADIVPIFEKSCGATDNACHSAVAYFANVGADCKGWLSLENRDLGAVYESATGDRTNTGCPDRSLYERLTELGGWHCAVNGSAGSGGVPIERKYVAPNDLANSDLWQKVVDGGDRCYSTGGIVSGQMPPGIDLPADTLATLEAWILAGAPE